MVQKLYPSVTAPSAPYLNSNVESMINKQLTKVSSFNKSIQNISLMLKYYEIEERNTRTNTPNES